MPKPPGIPNELFKYERRKRGWSQKDVADKIGVPDDKTIQRWELGKAIPGPYYRDKLAKLFGKSAKSLGFDPIGDIPFWRVPRRNTFFTGRENTLQLLHDTFLAQRAHQVSPLPLALSGLGGVGKSQIALEFVYRCRWHYHTVLWIQAASEEQLVADFTAVADLLGLPEKDAADPNVLIAAVKKWLTDLTRWLLIFDNADNLQLLERFLPDEIKGHILLTTRSQSTGQFAHRGILVEPLDDHSGAELLLHRAKILPLERTLEQTGATDAAHALLYSKSVGGLPLALDQAGAYIEETSESLEGYIELYQKKHHDLLNRRGSLEGTIQHPESVVSTFEISFTRACEQYPLAADLLRFCGFLQPDVIPEEVLLAADLKLDTLSLNEAVAALQGYSLIKRNAYEKIYSMHQLIQEVLTNDMDAEVSWKWRERVVRALATVFPDEDFAEWGKCARLLPHALICAAWTKDKFPPTLELAQLLFKAGVYLRERGQYANAEPLLERVCSIRQQYLEDIHPDIATAQYELGILYWREGKYEQAEPLLQMAYKVHKQYSGDDHPYTAKSLNGLAALYNSQGKYQEAERLYQHVLALWQRLDSKLNIAKTLNNLAELSQHLDQYPEAEKWYREALVLKESWLGRTHLSTAATLNNLAYLYHCTGRYQEAETLYQEVLSTFKKQAGETHPYTAGILNNLAELYWLQKQYEQAEPLYRHALALREQHLGKNHPDTAESLHGLARLQQAQGKHDEAEKLYRRALDIRKQRLKLEHPDIQRTRQDYADFLRSTGHNAEAAALESSDASS